MENKAVEKLKIIKELLIVKYPGKFFKIRKHQTNYEIWEVNEKNDPILYLLAYENEKYKIFGGLSDFYIKSQTYDNGENKIVATIEEVIKLFEL